MSISLIEFQPVRFRSVAQIDADTCNCSEKPFCQLVNKNDDTTWQIKTSSIIINGYFAGNLDGWTIGSAILVSLNVVNETAEGECDGSITVTPTGGTGPYTYSKDGVTFQSSNVFSDLCVGCYDITVKDSLGNLGFAQGCIDTNVDCSTYNSPDLFDLENTDLSKLLNCYLFDLL